MAPRTRSTGTSESMDTDLIYRGLAEALRRPESEYSYTFENFFHPFVDRLQRQLNTGSLDSLLDAGFCEQLKAGNNPSLAADGSLETFHENFGYEVPEDLDPTAVSGSPREIELSPEGAYSVYNWELFYHLPLMIAVHLSRNQRFAEAQRWFHFIFNPFSDNDAEPPARFWNFLPFRQHEAASIDALVAILSGPESQLRQQQTSALSDILDNPFQPHVVARHRQTAYQYSVVMKYLDNIIAWGDCLFMQDTRETLMESIQHYVLAANILGDRPQRTPVSGRIQGMSYMQLKNEGLGVLGDPLVAMENLFPFNSSFADTHVDDAPETGSLLGIGRTLYFCVPRNDKLLGYWDTVADRLFKIRHCMNIEGVVRQLPLFDPPLDPGMLVRAAAAGIDIGSAVAGLNQPVGSLRGQFLIQKALELCGEVRGLGGALLAAIEKGDGERMALLRQSHESRLQELTREVRFLQWQQARESTQSLLRGRKSTLERYRFHLRVLGLTPDNDAAPDELPENGLELTEENFDEVFESLVEQYDRNVPDQEYPSFETRREGKLFLHKGEAAELHEHSDRAFTARLSAAAAEAIAAAGVYIPNPQVKLAYWGIGTGVDMPVGKALQDAGRALSSAFNVWAIIEQEQGRIAGTTASYDRRAQDWILQANLSALELKQIGRQVIGSLITEQIARHEYDNAKKQIEQSQEVNRLLHEKFSSEELYSWMQGELTRLYYEYYRFAFDTARKAERVMKHELMRQEVDSTDYVKFNYWDGGRKGLLAGENLYLDLKRMEMAWHENNRREYELTRHISLRQLDPVALLSFRETGKCEFQLPEWLFDLDCPGHHMRRIKYASLSIPSVTGPFASTNCTLSLLKSTVRKSPYPGNTYEREDSDDERFQDYYGSIESIVTSTGDNDVGMFETNLHGERFLPFEGAGVISTWRLELPDDFRQFDYETIFDVILHVRYTARSGGERLKAVAIESLNNMFGDAETSELALLLNLKQDFPNEWYRFSTNTDAGSFSAVLDWRHLPYFVQGRSVKFKEQGYLAGKVEGTAAPFASGGRELGTNGLSIELAARDLDRTGDNFLMLGYTAVRGRDEPG